MDIAFAAMDTSDQMDLTMAQRGAIQTQTLASAILGVDIDGIIDRLTRRPGHPRRSPLKTVTHAEAKLLMRAFPDTSSTTID
jgi:hypothetical protein